MKGKKGRAMKRFLLPVVAISAIAFAAAPRFSFAQQQAQSQSQSQTQATPPGTNSANQTAPAKASAPAAKPAKIWTNDDLDALRSSAALSTVGSAAPSSKTASPPKSEKSQAQRADWYRKQLAPLYKQLGLLDDEIAKVKAFMNGENVGGQPLQPGRMYRSHMTPAEQLAFFESQRQKTQNAIDELLEAARREGIPPGMLR